MQRPSGRMAAEIEGLTKSFEGRVVIPGFTTTVNRGDKIVLAGRTVFVYRGATNMLFYDLSRPAGQVSKPENVVT